jgi:chloride channel 7
MFSPGEDAIHHLFSRNTHLQFGYAPLLTMFVIYYLLAVWAAGTFVASGIMVPMLLIGGLYGRVLGT